MASFSTLQQEQPQAVEALTAALRGGRLHHAYLFTGPVQTTLEQLSMAMASALVCKEPHAADGCGRCAGCRKLHAGNHPDVLHISPGDKGTIGIDIVRGATARLALRPTEARTKVVVLMRAECMNPAAQNALLKTLEEPAGATCFLLSSTRPRALLPTVRSRCQMLRLRPRSYGDGAAWQALVAAGAEPMVAQYVAALCGADLERAQALLDQGAADVVGMIAGCVQESTSGSALLRLAAELGGDKERADLALALFEVALRDALAEGRGVPRERLYVPDQTLPSLPTMAVCEAGQRLQLLRRQQVFNPNRTLALEGVLMALFSAGRKPKAAASQHRRVGRAITDE